MSLVVAAIVMAIFFAPLLLAMALLTLAGSAANGVLGGVIVIGSFAASIAGALAAVPRLALLGNERLRQEVGARVAATGTSGAVQSGLFVGVSPGAPLMQYDGDTDWDVGFLQVMPGWLAYYGDRARFALSPDQVGEMEIEPKKPQLMRESRLLIRWGDGSGGFGHILSVSPRVGGGRRVRHEHAERLRQEIEAWRAGPRPQPGVRTALPPVDASRAKAMPVTATSPGLAMAVGIPLAILGALGMAAVDKLTGTRIPMAAGISVIIGISFGLAQAIENRRKSGKH